MGKWLGGRVDLDEWVWVDGWVSERVVGWVSWLAGG